jgi:hypothetical protein
VPVANGIVCGTPPTEMAAPPGIATGNPGADKTSFDVSGAPSALIDNATVREVSLSSVYVI